MKKILGILAFLLTTSFTHNNTDDVERVSIINLIATPEKYNSIAISVDGYLVDEFENTRLYLDSESATLRMYENGVALFLDSTITHKDIEAYHKSYVRLEGVFHCSPNKFLPNWYSIHNVYKIKKLGN